jgi:putative ATPase
MVIQDRSARPWCWNSLAASAMRASWLAAGRSALKPCGRADCDEFVGQTHLLAPASRCTRRSPRGQLHSMILGAARHRQDHAGAADGRCLDAEFIALSAVLAGIKDIREAVARRGRRAPRAKPTVLFVDEVHRFNKAQQDAFLPHVEDGHAHLHRRDHRESVVRGQLGALLSRARCTCSSRSVDGPAHAARAARSPIARAGRRSSRSTRGARAARRTPTAMRGALLNMLELAAAGAAGGGRSATLAQALLEQAPGRPLRRFDKGGEQFYDQISALHKAVRGSDPTRAVLARAHARRRRDPHYLARRMIAHGERGHRPGRSARAADRARGLAGLRAARQPEGELALAQAVVYLAVAPRATRSTPAWRGARGCRALRHARPVPLHLRNAPTRLMKELGYGRATATRTTRTGAFAAGERYLPDDMPDRRYYRAGAARPGARIGEALERLRDRRMR